MSLINDIIEDLESLMEDLNEAVNSLDNLSSSLDELSLEAANMADQLNTVVHTIEDYLMEYKASQGPELPFEESVGDDKPSQ